MNRDKMLKRVYRGMCVGVNRMAWPARVRAARPGY